MKKLIFGLFLICLMMVCVGASPQLPYIVYGGVELNGEPLAGARLELIHNGNTIGITTNEQGKWIKQLSDYSDNDLLTIRVTDGCGAGDSCEKSFNICTKDECASAGYRDFAVVNFFVSGELTCPTCPSSSCSGGGSGGYVDLATEERCADKFPCETCSTPTQEECEEVIEISCPTCEKPVYCFDTNPKSHDDGICEVYQNQIDCENMECIWGGAGTLPSECEVCTTDEDKNETLAFILTSVFAIVGGIVGLVLGKYSWFAGFKGLSEYRIKEGIKAIKDGKYDKAKIQLGAAFKMFKTSLEKAKEGKYD